MLAGNFYYLDEMTEGQREVIIMKQYQGSHLRDECGDCHKQYLWEEKNQVWVPLTNGQFD